MAVYLNTAPVPQMLKELQGQPNWINIHFDQAKTVSENLESLKVTASPEIQEVYKILLERHPELFPKITISFNLIEKSISRHKLAKESEKFRAILDPKLKTSEWTNKKIELSIPENMGIQVLEDFLNYLDSGKINITGECIFDLIRLADEHCVPLLFRQCLKWVMKNINTETCLEFLDFSIHYPLVELQWICLIFMDKKRIDRYPELQSKMELIDACKKLDIHFKFAAEEIYVIFRRTKSICFEALEIMKEICGSISLREFHFYKTEMTDENLFCLASFIDSPKTIRIHKAGITELPFKWSQSIEFLQVSECNELVELVLASATNVSVAKNRSLQKVVVPLANTLYCDQCEQLKEVFIPKTQVLTITHCKSLKEVMAPSADTIHYTGSSELHSLEVNSGCIVFDEPSVTERDDLQIQIIREEI